MALSRSRIFDLLRLWIGDYNSVNPSSKLCKFVVAMTWGPTCLSFLSLKGTWILIPCFSFVKKAVRMVEPNGADLKSFLTWGSYLIARL